MLGRPPEIGAYAEVRKKEETATVTRKFRRALSHASGLPMELQQQQQQQQSSSSSSPSPRVKWTLATLRHTRSPSASSNSLSSPPSSSTTGRSIGSVRTTQRAAEATTTTTPAPAELPKDAAALAEVNRRLVERGERPVDAAEAAKLLRLGPQPPPLPPAPQPLPHAVPRVLELERQVDALSARCAAQAADIAALQARCEGCECGGRDDGFRLARHFADMKASFEVQLQRSLNAGVRIGELVATERYEERIAQLTAAASPRAMRQMQRMQKRASETPDPSSLAAMQRQLAERDAEIMELRTRCANLEAQLMLETLIVLRRSSSEEGTSQQCQQQPPPPPPSSPPSPGLAPTAAETS